MTPEFKRGCARIVRWVLTGIAAAGRWAEAQISLTGVLGTQDLAAGRVPPRAAETGPLARLMDLGIPRHRARRAIRRAGAEADFNALVLAARPRKVRRYV